MHDIYGPKDRTGGNVDHLHILAAGDSVNYQPPAVIDYLRVWWAGMLDDVLRLIRQDAVLGNVVDVPGVPNEFHGPDYLTTLFVLTSSGHRGRPPGPFFPTPYNVRFQAPYSLLVELGFKQSR